MSNANTLSDNEIIKRIKESSEDLDLIYKKHKDYCLNFMKRINHNDELNQDIFHDAIIVLYEKIMKPDFTALTCSIQTYLNSICRNQLLVRLKKESKHSEYSEEYDTRIDDWFKEDESEKTEKEHAIEKALEKLKDLGGKCYDILKLFFYQNQSMEKIAYELDYKNAANARNKKSHCQKKLKELVFDLIKK